MFGTLLGLTLSQKLMNNIPVCVSWSPSVCVCAYVCDEAEEVRGLATVYRAGPRLCKVHRDCERNRNDPERQDTQLHGRQNIKEATQFTSVSAQLDSVCTSHLISTLKRTDKQSFSICLLNQLHFLHHVLYVKHCDTGFNKAVQPHLGFIFIGN